MARIVRLVHEHGPLTRAELTARTGLNRSTIGALTTELVERGVVDEGIAVGDGRAGRPSFVVRPLSHNIYVLALDVGAEELVAARVGLGGPVQSRVATHYQAVGRSPADTVAALGELSRKALADAPADGVCVGIGVSICGIVQRDDGQVRFAPNLGWVDVPLGDLLAAELHTRLPVVVGNNADLGALAERVRGVAVGADNVVFVACEVGIGGGIIVNGHRITGVGGYAGEIGHMRVNPRGRLCRCGARGCWETEIGEEAVRTATGMAPTADVADIVAAFERGDRRTRAGVRRVGRWLGLGLSNIVNTFNPEVIVIGGPLWQLLPLVSAQVDQALETSLLAPRQQVRIALPGLGSDSSLLGAAEAAFEDVLSDPLGTISRRTAALSR